MDSSEKKQLAELLKKLEPGLLPYDIFVQIARLTVLSIIEFVPLRQRGGVVEVLLLDRTANDPIWPNELHTPGTVIRPTDTSGEIYKAFERIRVDELGGTEISNGHFVGTILHPSKRGMENAQIFWVEVIGEPKVGQFYSEEELPEMLMESQKKFIQQAIKNYKSSKKNETD